MCSHAGLGDPELGCKELVGLAGGQALLQCHSTEGIMSLSRGWYQPVRLTVGRPWRGRRKLLEYSTVSRKDYGRVE